MSMYQMNDDDYGHLVGAQVTGVPILVPSLKARKNKLVFPVLCDSEEYMCVVWGKTALTLCHHINIGKTINVYGKEKPGHRMPIVHVRSMMVQGPIIDQAGVMYHSATFEVDKPKIWDYLSKVPGISRLIPEAMKL